MKKTYLCSLIIVFACSWKVCAQNPTGFIKFQFNSDSAYVITGHQQIEAEKLATDDSLEFDTGVQLIFLQTHFDKSNSLYVHVFEDSTVTYSYSFKENNFTPATLNNNIAARHYYNSNVMVLSDEDSEIYYEGELKGTGFALFEAPEDIVQLEIRNPDFGATERRLNVRDSRINYMQSFHRPQKNTSRVFSVIPGASQAYKRQYLKAALFGVAAAGVFSYTVIKHSQYDQELNVFHEYQEKYDNATNEQDAIRWGDLTQIQHDKVRQLDNLKRFSLLSGILIYGYNIYDALTSPPKGGYHNKDKDLEFYLSQEQISDHLNTTGTIRYNF